MNKINIITLSAWVGFLNGIFQICRESNEQCHGSCSGHILSWQIHSWKSDWHAQHSPTGIETDNAYMSNSGHKKVKLSRDFASVGCHIGMSKYLTRKGHTPLSKTWNRENFPKTNNQYKRQMQIIYKHRSIRFDKELDNARWSKTITGAPRISKLANASWISAS